MSLPPRRGQEDCRNSPRSGVRDLGHPAAPQLSPDWKQQQVAAHALFGLPPGGRPFPVCRGDRLSLQTKAGRVAVGHVPGVLIHAILGMKPLYRCPWKSAAVGLGSLKVGNLYVLQHQSILVVTPFAPPPLLRRRGCLVRNETPSTVCGR